MGAQREREEAAEAEEALEDDGVRVVQSPIRVAKIIRAYEREAAQGNANAGRELRAWLDQYPPQDTDISTESMERGLRQKVLARLLAEIESEEAAQSTNP